MFATKTCWHPHTNEISELTTSFGLNFHLHFDLTCFGYKLNFDSKKTYSSALHFFGGGSFFHVLAYWLFWRPMTTKEKSLRGSSWNLGFFYWPWGKHEWIFPKFSFYEFIFFVLHSYWLLLVIKSVYLFLPHVIKKVEDENYCKWFWINL